MGKKTNGIASGKGHAGSAKSATSKLPPARDPVAEELGHTSHADQAIPGLPAPPRHSDDPRIQEIMALARERRDWMQLRLRTTARLVDGIRRRLQPSRAQEEKWDDSTKEAAKAIAAEAIAFHKRELENYARELSNRKLLKACLLESDIAKLNFVNRVARSIAEWSLEEDAVLDRMVEIAATLEIASFVSDPERKGFTLAGLAVIIGHAGHPLDYPTKGHLWKRLGLAPYGKNGVTRVGSSWGRFGGLDKNDWIELGYSRSRLGDIFGKITQPLLYAQHRASGPALGPYGEAYGRYKRRQKDLNESGAFAEEAARQVASAKKAGKKPQKALLEGKLPDSAINARALRVMTKKLIADLWSAWRRLSLVQHGDRPNGGVLAAATDIERKARAEVSEKRTTERLPTAQPIDGEANTHVATTPIEAMPSRQPNGTRAIGALPETANDVVPASRPIPRQRGQAGPADKAKSCVSPGAEPVQRRKGRRSPAAEAISTVPAAADPPQEAA